MCSVSNLRAARALITPPGAWLPVSFEARAKDGRTVPCRSREAVAWGALGALVAVTGPHDDRVAELAALRGVTGAKHFCDWHSEAGRTQAEVLDAFDRAMAEVDDAPGYRSAA